MAIETRIDPFDRDIALMIDELLSPAAQSAALADFARQALAEAEAQNAAALGHVSAHDTFVDGMASNDADLDRVRPDGAILFRFDLVLDVFQWIDEALILHSPMKSGRYARSHLFFADDIEADIANPPPAREYAFVNAQPYARKIERGLSSHAPDGVYEGVAELAKQRFGNVTRIKFSYRSLPADAIGDWAASTTLTRKGRNDSGVKLYDWLTRQPAVVISV